MANQMALMVCLIVAVVLFKGATAADVYFVGDELGWKIPPGGSADYYNWARNKTFEIDDTIVFNWTGTHTVAEVSHADYDSCTKTNPISSIQDTSPANVTLNSNETRYFICTIGTHCKDGQKVTINIGEVNSASSLTVHTSSAIVTTIIMALLSYYI